MALTVSNNGAVAAASYYLGKNQDALQTSIKRLASGKKIVGGAQDPGTLAVSMKVNAAINRLSGAQNNIRNAQGFLEVQDGLIESAGKIVMRMSELKGYASQDPLKGEQDIASYNNEFKDLQIQLYQISQLDFNGMSLFANFTSNGQGGSTATATVFNGSTDWTATDHTLDIYTSTKGSSGSKVSIHKSALLSALTMQMTNTGINIGQDWDSTTITNNNAVLGTGASSKITLAVDADSTDAGMVALTLDQVSSGVFEKALENVVFLRAQNGGGLSRLSFAGESMATQETNMRAALGRIEDVDIAAEAANLSKYSILMQASAAMVAQANSQNDVALMLLR
ncbi:flagellin [Opitutales bacterium]|nr:flagellin [Opitutales bacterium]